MTLQQQIDCGEFGYQEFNCLYDRSGFLVACYSTIDRNEKINLKPELSKDAVVHLEREALELRSGVDPLRLAKIRAEDDMDNDH